jgi:hypothetical protein
LKSAETGERSRYADDVATILGFSELPRICGTNFWHWFPDGDGQNWPEIHGKLPTNWKDLIRFENDATRFIATSRC